MKQLISYLKQKFILFLKKIWEYIYLFYDMVFLEKPRYLMPLRFFAVTMLILIQIGNIKIHILPREFKDWVELEDHIWGIIKTLYYSGHEDWVSEVRSSLYVSQSYYERRDELLISLYALLKQKFVKKLNIKKDIKKAISYLRSI